MRGISASLSVQLKEAEDTGHRDTEKPEAGHCVKEYRHEAHGQQRGLMERMEDHIQERVEGKH